MMSPLRKGDRVEILDVGVARNEEEGRVTVRVETGDGSWWSFGVPVRRVRRSADRRDADEKSPGQTGSEDRGL